MLIRQWGLQEFGMTCWGGELTGLDGFLASFDLGVGARLGRGTVHYGWSLVSDSHSRHCQILIFWATRLDFTFGILQSCFFLCVI